VTSYREPIRAELQKDLQVGAKYFAARRFDVVGGYRYSRYKVEDNTHSLLVRQHGPFFGGVVRF